MEIVVVRFDETTPCSGSMGVSKFSSESSHGDCRGYIREWPACTSDGSKVLEVETPERDPKKGQKLGCRIPGSGTPARMPYARQRLISVRCLL